MLHLAGFAVSGAVPNGSIVWSGSRLPQEAGAVVLCSIQTSSPGNSGKPRRQLTSNASGTDNFVSRGQARELQGNSGSNSGASPTQVDVLFEMELKEVVPIFGATSDDDEDSPSAIGWHQANDTKGKMNTRMKDPSLVQGTSLFMIDSSDGLLVNSTSTWSGDAMTLSADSIRSTVVDTTGASIPGPSSQTPNPSSAMRIRAISSHQIPGVLRPHSLLCRLAAF